MSSPQEKRSSQTLVAVVALLAGLVLVTLLVIGGSGRRGGAGAGSAQGMPMPEFTLASLGGSPVSKRDFAGRVVLFDFWATWCGPCRRGIPDFVELHAAYAGRGLAILGVGLDQEGAAALKPFAEKLKISYPVLLGNQETAKRWGGVAAIPATFIVDRKGIVRKQYVGFQPKPVLEAAVSSLLAE